MTSLLSACLALPAATLPLVLNARAPGRDTLQSWTCGWVSQGLNTHDGMPGDFGRVCGESVSLGPNRFFRLMSVLRCCGSDDRSHPLLKTIMIAVLSRELKPAVQSTSTANQADSKPEPKLINPPHSASQHTLHSQLSSCISHS